MMHAPSRRQPGFSLIEVLVAIALISILSGIGVSLYAIVNNSYSRAHTISTIQSRASSAIETLERSIRSATEATSPSCSASSCSLLLSIAANSTMFSEYNNSSNPASNCTKVLYTFTAGNGNDNGTLTRQWQNDAGTSCGGSGIVNVFNSSNPPNRDSISVKTLSGADIFFLNAPDDGVKSVLVRMDLRQGGGVTNAASVPITTTVSLRPSGE